MVDPELATLRSAIDDLDAQLLEVLARRVQVVLAVGEYKRARRLAVYDPERERQMMQRLGQLAQPPLDASTVRRVFERIIDESRRLEQLAMNRREE